MDPNHERIRAELEAEIKAVAGRFLFSPVPNDPSTVLGSIREQVEAIVKVPCVAQFDGTGRCVQVHAGAVPLVHDILVDVPIGSEDVLEHHAGVLGNARIIHDPDDPDELFFTPASEDADGGWAVVRVRDAADPQGTARELQRRVMGLRIVGVYKR